MEEPVNPRVYEIPQNKGKKEWWAPNGTFILPLWSHLYMSQSEMYISLRNKIPAEVAEKFANHLFYDNFINRLHFDDYIDFAKASKFQKISVMGYAPTPAPTAILERLSARYPRRGNWEFSGQMLYLQEI